MSFEADWSLNICLSCDGETFDGHYCSLACRLADSQRSGFSNSTSPSSSFTSTNNGFSLPPAIDFSIYRSQPTSTLSYRDSTNLMTSSISDPKYLSRSSSMSSNSTRSSFTPEQSRTQEHNLSEETRYELMRYESFFDRTRYRR